MISCIRLQSQFSFGHREFPSPKTTVELSITQDYSGSLDLCIYPDIDLQVLHNTVFLVQIHEPIIWRLNELIQKVDISNIFGSQTTSDPMIQIGALKISEVRFRIMMGITNTIDMEVRLNEREQQDLNMRSSIL